MHSNTEVVVAKRGGNISGSTVCKADLAAAFPKPPTG